MSAHRIIDSSFRPTPNVCALTIMTKAPHPGKVKTRLVPPLTSKEAAALNICFLRDLSASISRACRDTAARGVAAFTPPDAADAYQGILDPSFLLIRQRGEEFGDRLVFATEDLLRAGFGSVCLINSDSPTVSPAVFAHAANVLAEPTKQVVLGPAHDGGYYLIGMRRLDRRLFEDIDWSTDRVFEQSKQRAGELGLPVYELPLGFDIDDREGLRRLCTELLSNEATTKEVAIETRRFLCELRTKKPGMEIFAE